MKKFLSVLPGLIFLNCSCSAPAEQEQPAYTPDHEIGAYDELVERYTEEKEDAA